MCKDVASLLADVFRADLTGKHIVVSRYKELSDEILDDVLEIDEVFPESELEEISRRFEQYLAEYSVQPFLGIIGGNVVCVGIGKPNRGRVFYYDFDFGFFELDKSVGEFVSGLQS